MKTSTRTTRHSLPSLAATLVISAAFRGTIRPHDLCNLLDFHGLFVLYFLVFPPKRTHGSSVAIVMTSRRKQLEREIARTKDPVIRMQLRELLASEERQQEEKGIRRIEENLDSLLRNAIARLPGQALLVLVVLVITLILFIIFLIAESGA